MKKQVALLVLSVLLNVSQVSSQDCGAYVAPGKWKQFMCHNLGAANPAADPFTPGWEIVGGYWQWGRKTMAAAGPTGISRSRANDGEQPGYSYFKESPNGSWSDAYKTGNDPCPAGFRVPSDEEWASVLAYNALKRIGNWDNRPTNYTSGLFIGDKLFLPAAGYRYYVNGTLDYRGYYGIYWSSTENGANGAWDLDFGIDDANANYYDSRTNGLSVRCIAE